MFVKPAYVQACRRPEEKSGKEVPETPKERLWTLEEIVEDLKSIGKGEERTYKLNQSASVPDLMRIAALACRPSDGLAVSIHLKDQAVIASGYDPMRA